ncbi:AI-2E family transporter [Crocosphaera sp. UHCC 0190]|uniref:AI-2E family transporter n=1 Tax=Crocosphaera sp. UHCC 0190 TaxID=3110246 RepID=UPI002B1FBB3F|nr:AI-2E family transporter [Crocosphaera sp. UHCC 0190]MEA5510241.1 AI-2E family transporter [Crocosphaera sp. UHCC 0190]
MIPKQQISISFSNLFLIAGSGFAILLLWHLRGLLVILMIAVVIASTLSPLVKSVEKIGFPRWLAVISVYLGLLFLITGISFLLGPTIISQIQNLLEKFPVYLEVLGSEIQTFMTQKGFTEPDVIEFINRLFNLQSLVSWTLRSSQQLLIGVGGLTRGIIGSVFNVILAILLSGYMLSGSKNLVKGIVSLFPVPWDERLEAQVIPVSQKMGGYIQGRLLVSFILGLAVSLGLKFLGLGEFALGLGTIAGITNLIPFFGPVLGSIPALIVAVAQGGWFFLWVLLLFVIIQNVETYVLDPLLVGSSVNVPPLYQLLGVLSGVQLLGILGALILPPWVAGGGVLLENLYVKPKLAAQKAATQQLDIPSKISQ